MSIPVYEIANAKHDKIPKHSEVVQDQEIKPNGFAYVRDLPHEQRNYTWYAVKEDDHVALLGIQDLIVEKEGTKLYLPVRTSVVCRRRTAPICMHASNMHPLQESLAKPTLNFESLDELKKEPGAVVIRALAFLPPPKQINPEVSMQE